MDKELKEQKIKQNYSLEKICENCKHMKTQYLPLPRGSFKIRECSIGKFSVKEKGTCDLFEQE